MRNIGVVVGDRALRPTYPKSSYPKNNAVILWNDAECESTTYRTNSIHHNVAFGVLRWQWLGDAEQRSLHTDQKA